MLKNIRIVALASFMEGLVILIWLASIPTSGTFSPVRLVSLFGILLVALGCLIGFIYIKSENCFAQKISQIAEGKFGLPLSWLLTTISLAVWVTILYKDLLLAVIDEAVYARLLPIAVFGILLCLQLGILFLIPSIHKDLWKNVFGPVWKPTIVILGCFLAVWVLMSVTHLGFVFDNVGLSWGPPGTPISFQQINLVVAVSASLAFAYYISQLHISLSSPVRDILIFTGLWGLAVVLWWNAPISETHFNPPPMAPNYETYPNSDALIFDKSAYHLLYGIGFSNQLHRRPIYVGMLALFHKFGDSGYENTIFLQILVLAFIPPLTYLLTSKLSNQLAGLIAGGLILLREKNTIELSGRIVTSNAKLMMSDMVAMLGVIAFIYVTAKLLSAKDRRSPWLLGITGACLGLTALVRAQVFILVPPLLLFILLERRPLKIRIRETILVILGLTLVISPWVWRNWNLTSTFVLDDRGEEKLLARNYSQNPVAFPPLLAGETEKEYSARIKREIIAYVIEHPADVAFFVSNHLFRNLATSAVYIAPAYSTAAHLDLVDQTQFWDDWDGMLTSSSRIPLFVTLVLVAFGIGIAQAKDSHAGWFPFVAFLFYSVGNALVRSSGWRFSLPDDWIVLVYFSIALAYLPSKIRFTFDGQKTVQDDNSNLHVTQKPIFEVIILCLFLLVGASMPIAEWLIPVNDFSNLAEDAEEKLSLENILLQTELKTFLEQEGAVFYSGLALYPRHITPNSRIYLANAPEDFRFLHFWLINDGDHQIVLPLLDSPGDFPHMSKVSIIGCQEDNYILAWAVIQHTPEEKIILQGSRFTFSCPLAEPGQN
ncbi:MAG TPA: glycosyltransferase family 39 protein [Anaerolineales bacterium]